MTAEANARERAAVDATLDEMGAHRSVMADRSGHAQVAIGGFHQASRQRHMLLPTLLAVQDAVGWVSEGALAYISQQLAVPPADVYGVATFYALISTEPRPARMVHLCDDIACKLAGADQIKSHLDAEIGPALSHAGPATSTSAGWAPSPCLGQCERAPAAFIQEAGSNPKTAVRVDSDEAVSLVAGENRSGPPEVAVSAPQLASSREGAPLLGRVGIVDPMSPSDYRSTGGYLALTKAIAMGPEAVIEQIETSGLRGRGGAAFPMGLKWRGAAAQPGPRYIICNADESEPGTFKDRVLLEGDPFAVIEAMTIAGFAVGAERGYLYIRGEYPTAIEILSDAMTAARSEGMLGDDVAGAGFNFDIEIRRGGGAYICGEETALFNSIEGLRGEPRQKPPFPTEAGLFGRPTVVNNVETLVNVPHVLVETGAGFAAAGTQNSSGTKLFCVSGHVAKPGVYEVEFGATINQLLKMAGGVSGRLRTVLMGGAAGAFVGPEMLDVPLTFEATREAGIPMGSGVVMAFDTDTDFDAITSRIAEFFRDESCGQCVPCRVGTVRQSEALHAALRSPDDDSPLRLLEEIDQVMRDASICGLGQTAGSAIQSALQLGLIGAPS